MQMTTSRYGEKYIINRYIIPGNGVGFMVSLSKRYRNSMFLMVILYININLAYVCIKMHVQI